MRVGRNEPCPCGSGKKYKNCCEGKEQNQAFPKGVLLLVAAIVAIAAIGFIPSFLKSDAPAAETAPIAPVAAQPSGPAPAGKVWSKEHGHWHDAQPVKSSANSGIQVEATGAPFAASTNSSATAPVANVAQPAGAVPAGKVWSKEHGHWHNAPTAAQRAPSPLAPSTGNPSGLRVMGQPVNAMQPQPQPPGPVPAGKVWSPEHGHWHDLPKQ
jgi:hypothetical protein